MTAKGDFFPRRINDYVPNMQYAADVRFGGLGTIRIPAPIVADPDGILAGVSIATAVDTTAFEATLTEDAMSKFGRNVTVVASGAATSNVTVYGKDYLGQPMVESFTLNGSTPVVGLKAFRYIDRITAGVTAATTIDVGWGARLGLPYRLIDAVKEVVDQTVAANAGTFVNAVAIGTSHSATTGDPRGTYQPHSSNVPNGSRNYDLTCLWDTTQLHGEPHFFN